MSERNSQRSADTVLILGATSMIARATTDEFARAGYDLILAGRSGEEVERVAADAGIRHNVHVTGEAFDALDTDSHAQFIARLIERCGGRLAGAVVAFGLLGEAERAERDFDHAGEIIGVNYVGAVSVLTHLAAHFAEKKKGFIVGISSVAGDRGRASNYVYGSAKGGFSLFLQGLRNRLHKSGVHVVTVKPGFIDTRMTFGVVRSPLVADPAVVGRAIARAVRKKRSIVYVPGFWRYIMWVIRLIPEFIFKRLSL